MKKIFALGAFVFGVAFFAQAQSSTPAPAPKKNAQLTEAPRPANNDAAGIQPNGDVAPLNTTRTSNGRTENNQLQPSGQAPTSTKTTTTTPSRSTVVSPDNRVTPGDVAPVPTTTPVVKPTAPKK